MTTNVLDLITIQTDGDTLRHVAKKGYANGFEYDVVFSVERANALDSGAIDYALDNNLITDDANSLPDNIVVWRYEDDYEVAYYADKAHAVKRLHDTLVDYYHTLAMDLDDEVSDNSHSPMNPYAGFDYMADGIAEEELTPAYFRQWFVTALQHGDYNMSEPLARYIVAEFERMTPNFFGNLTKVYRPAFDEVAYLRQLLADTNQLVMHVTTELAIMQAELQALKALINPS